MGSLFLHPAFAALIATAFSLSACVLIVGGFLFSERKRFEKEDAMQERLDELAGRQGSVELQVLRGARLDVGLLSRRLAGSTFANAVKESVARAGLSWSSGHVVGFSVLGATVGVGASLVLPVAAAALLGAAGAAMPFAVVARRLTLRTRKIEQQMPEAIDMLANALRAGYSLPASMSFVGSELSAPVGPELLRFHDEQRLGVDTRQALENLQQRLGTVDSRMLVLAITVQRETGGNLSEILASIANVIRGRMTFRDQVSILTAESRASAIMLAALPVALFLILQVVSPDYTSELTGTERGQQMLSYAAVSLTIGFLWMRRAGRVEM